MKAKFARLDPNGTAKPLTRLTQHIWEGHCRHIDNADTYQNLETGEKISLRAKSFQHGQLRFSKAFHRRRRDSMKRTKFNAGYTLVELMTLLFILVFFLACVCGVVYVLYVLHHFIMKVW